MARLLVSLVLASIAFIAPSIDAKDNPVKAEISIR